MPTQTKPRAIWNKDRIVGPKKGFEQLEAQQIADYLEAEGIIANSVSSRLGLIRAFAAVIFYNYASGMWLNPMGRLNLRLAIVSKKHGVMSGYHSVRIYRLSLWPSLSTAD